MERFAPGAGFARILLGLVLLNAAVFIPLVPVFGSGEISAEDGPMENMQAVLLVASAVAFLYAAWREREAPRLAFYLCGILCVVLFLRELQLPPTGPVTTYLRSKAFRLHETVVVLLLVVPYLIVARRHIPEIVRFGLSRACWPLYVAALFVLAGEAIDKLGKDIFGVPMAQFIEELAENAAFLILTATALLVAYRSGSASGDRPTPA